jgi:hypothetical protein
MRAGERMASPNVGGYDRLAALGDMLSGVAGVAGPAAAVGRAGAPAAAAVMEGLLGGSPTTQAAGDMARQFAMDESGALRLFHGSPHDFDRFSLDKIGTGEGAQAYGHGLYFAEAEDVAKQYRDQLSRGWKASEDYLWKGKPASSHYEDAISRGDYGKALVWEQVQLHGTRDAIRQDLLDEISGGSNQAKQALQFLDTLPDDIFAKPSGRMYEVNVNANPEDFLDWDAPLSAQPNVARRLGLSTRSPDDINAEAENIMMTGPSGKWMEDPAKLQRVRELQDELDNAAPPLTGQEYYRGGADGDVSNILSQMGYGNPQDQTRALAERGIPGIRYLDAGSRADGGTRNYVVFDEKLISIVRKYGIAGAAAMLGMSQSEVAQAANEYNAPKGNALAPYRNRAE